MKKKTPEITLFSLKGTIFSHFVFIKKSLYYQTTIYQRKRKSEKLANK